MSSFGLNLLIILICLPSNSVSQLNEPSPTETQNLSNDGTESLLTISTSIKIVGLSSIDLMNSEFQMDFFMALNWSLTVNQCEKFYLNLLKSSERAPFMDLVGERYIIEKDILKKVWIPNTYMGNVKSMVNFDGVYDNRLLEISRNSDSCQVRFTTRLSAKVGCKMNFQEYPNDVQHCPFTLTSYFWPESIIKYQWNDPPISYESEAIDQNHYQISVTTESFVKPGYDRKNRTWLAIGFTFHRKLAHFVHQAIIPSILIIISAYFSFWISIDSGPGRYMFTALPFFSLITLYNGLKGELPPVSYISASDVWMLATLSFDFVTICIMTCCVHLSKQDKQLKMVPSNIESKDLESIPEISVNDSQIETRRFSWQPQNGKVAAIPSVPDGIGKKCSCWRCRPLLRHLSLFNCKARQNDETISSISRADRLDDIMKIIFPLAFLIFNLIYWILVNSGNAFS